MDSDGDGEGDLPGVISRLDYLVGLGVDAIWLSPFYPSPLADGGYDVADARDVDPRFGTLADACRLIDTAHAKGLKVIVDVVPNHVSVAHKWFQAAIQAPAGSPEHARFHVLPGRGAGGEQPPNNWIGVFGGSAWSPMPHGARDEMGNLLWYLHVFDSSQPDLNWTNPEIVADSEETLRFWLELGVDGFRVDVAFGLAKDMTYSDHPDPQSVIHAMRLDLNDGVQRDPDPRAALINAPFFDRDEVHEVYRRWRTILDSYPGPRIAVAEAWAYPVERAMAYARPDELHQVFNFDFLLVQWAAEDMRRVIASVLEAVAIVGAPASWVLSNHDTPRVVTRLGGGPLGQARALALAHVAHFLPGCVYIYNGEELGLPDAEIPADRRADPIWFRSGGTDPGRDGARAPMPWRGATPPYGFSRNPGTWLPAPPGWADRTVESESSDPGSHLNHYRRMIAVRRSHPDLSDPGSAFSATVPIPGLLRIERGSAVCLANTSDAPIRMEGSLSARSRILVASNADTPALSEDGLVIPTDTCIWLG
jgi:alpha-glucosidase